MVDHARARKLAGRIQEIVAQALETQVKDPRLGMVTITDTKVTGDLQNATVYYTVYGDDTEAAASAVALESAKGVLRSLVGRQTGIRLTPTLTFVADNVPDHARAIDELLVKAKEADNEVHRKAAGASYAGDPDPYRLDDEADETADGTAGEPDDPDA